MIKHEFEFLNTKPRGRYICKNCFLKFAEPFDSICTPNAKEVKLRKAIYQKNIEKRAV